ncbi:uncharacterized protein BJX67DRAFT_380960 [Aspergillus lucknowensis]|uniref:Uncharacterized protein n=1 Tax=Aspergillus lucknowensis TaxID=176173 RepID=A0ABR4LU11_9EURO
MPASGRDEQWLRAQLHSLGDSDPDKQPLQPLYSTYAATWSPADEDQAVLLLTQASELRRNGEIKTLINVSKVKQDKWLFEDYETVLKQTVGATSVPVGVIASVLKHLADNQPKKARTGSLKFRRSVKENDIHSLMSGLFTTSLMHNRLDQLRALAHAARSAGQLTVVSRALPTAVQMDNIQAAQILIEEGADTNTCPKVFLSCLEAGKREFIRLLLRSQNTVSQNVTTGALPAAVKLGDIETVQLLLAHGANAEAQKGLALKHAIDTGCFELMVLLLLSKKHPTGSTLASMVSYVWTEYDAFAGRQGKMIEILLNGGACGNDVDTILLGAVEERWGELARLLMSKGTTITCCNAQAYRHAVHAIDYEMLQILDTDKLGKELATDIFLSINTTRHGAEISPQDWWKLATLLLAQGASGEVVDEALVNRVSVRDLKSVRLLLVYGASVDYNNGNALGIAVSSEDMDYIQSILRHEPKAETVNAIFPRVATLSHRVQLDITRKLLEAGATGEAVDEVLSWALTVPACQRDRPFVEALVTGGANVEQKEGFFIHEVVRDGDFDTLVILLRGVSSTAILHGCIPLAMDLDERRQYRILAALLDAGIRGGPLIAQALVDSIDETKQSAVRVTELLLTTGAANTAFNDGEAFKKAIVCKGLEFLQLLVPFNQLDESQFCSCLGIAISLPRDDMRVKKLKLLLTAGVNMSSEHWNTSLRHEMVLLRDAGEGSSVVLRLLLDAGADVNYHHGQIICTAIEDGLFEAFQMYLGHSLTTQSHEAAFTTALTYAIENMDLRFMREILKLETPTDILNNALVVTAGRGKNMRDFCELLLEHKASPSYNNGAPLCCAIRSSSYHPRLIEVLLKYKPTTEAIAAALDCAFSALGKQQRLDTVNLLLTCGKAQEALNGLLIKAVQEESCDPNLLKALLRANASVLYKDGECIFHSVMKNDVGSLHILQPYFANRPGVVTHVFKRAWEKGVRAETHEAALSMLLKAGATGFWTDVALADTIETFDTSTNSMALILSLLDAGADVNYCNGLSLVKASAKGNLRVLKELFAHSPSRDNVTRAFPHIFTSGVDKSILRDLVRAFCSHSSRPDFTDSPGLILQRLIKHYPTEKDLLKYLIDSGCPAKSVVKSNGTIYTSLLSWALAESTAKVSDEIIDILLSGGADPNYTTTYGRPPLEVAILASRREAVSSLLRHGADPTTLAGVANSKSLLFLAVTTGDIDIVRFIVQASPEAHDGALHFAAGEMNVKILEILTVEGKQRDYAYSGCDGRTALAELCMKADGNRFRLELPKAMTLLKDTRTVTMKSYGKSALHLALDNKSNPVSVTRALLDSCMGEYINDDFNLYEDAGFVYSPLAYVLKRLNGASNSLHRDKLVKLLTQFGCKNRFWALEGNHQPSDVINAPEYITRLINQEKDHERMLARIRARSELAQEKIAAQHELLLKNELEFSNLRTKLENEAEARHLKHVSDRCSAELANDNLSDQYSKFARERRQAEMEHLKKQQELITAAYKERAEIERKNREANARETRRLREMWYEIDPWD